VEHANIHIVSREGIGSFERGVSWEKADRMENEGLPEDPPGDTESGIDVSQSGDCMIPAENHCIDYAGFSRGKEVCGNHEI
jgi:hypothetical protein